MENCTIHELSFFFIENDEINIDEILVGNFIHDCSERNDIYLVLIKASSVIAHYLKRG